MKLIWKDYLCRGVHDRTKSKLQESLNQVNLRRCLGIQRQGAKLRMDIISILNGSIAHGVERWI